MKKEELIREIIQKQFQMAGHPVVWKDIPEDGLIQVKKKKKYWYEIYKFKNEDQYNEWRKWATDKLSKLYKGNDLESEMNYIDLRYGMAYEIEKEIKKGEQTELPF